MLSRLGSYMNLDWRRIYSQAHVVVGNIQFLADCWTEGLSVLWEVIQMPPPIPCQVALFTSNSQGGSLPLQSQQGRTSLSMTGIIILCNAITCTESLTCNQTHCSTSAAFYPYKQVTDHFYSQGERITQGVNTRRWGSWGWP